MSEKRFTMKYSFEDEEYVFYEDGIPLTPSQTVNNLNEQQDTINRQTEQHKARLNKLIDKNGELQMRIVKQQATIQSLKEENASLKQRIRDMKYNNCGD